MQDSATQVQYIGRLNLSAYDKKANFAKIGNAVCIDNLIKRNCLFSPSRIEAGSFVKQTKTIYNLSMVKYKKQIAPHKKKEFEPIVKHSKSDLFFQSIPELKQSKHRRNISAVWNTKKMSLDKKVDNGKYLASGFKLTKVEKQSSHQLKMSITKMQSVNKAIKIVNKSFSQKQSRGQNEQNKKIISDSDNIKDIQAYFMQFSSQKGCIRQDHIESKTQQLKLMSLVELPQRYSEQQKFGQPFSTKYKERLFKSTLVSYKSKIRMKKKKQQQQVENQKQKKFIHIRHLIQQKRKLNEENLEQHLIEPLNFKILKLEMPSPSLQKTSLSYSVYQINHASNIMKPILIREDQRRVQIASLTKIMTCILTISIANLFKLDIKVQKVLVSQKASRMPGTSGQLKYSDMITVYQLLHALMLPSGNDAAVALAEWGGKTIRKYCSLANRCMNQLNGQNKLSKIFQEGNIQKKSHYKLFVHYMNKSAQLLQLKNTHFANSHGLMNEKAYSTSTDIAKLTCFAMSNPFFKQIVIKKQHSTQIFNRMFSHNRTVRWQNTNKLLWVDGFIGVKTGVTPSAGPCLTSMFSINEQQSVVIVVLRTKTMELRFKQSFDLLKQALRVLEYDKIDELDKVSLCGSNTTSASDNEKGEEANLIQPRELSFDQDDLDDDDEDN